MTQWGKDLGQKRPGEKGPAENRIEKGKDRERKTRKGGWGKHWSEGLFEKEWWNRSSFDPTITWWQFSTESHGLSFILTPCSSASCYVRVSFFLFLRQKYDRSYFSHSNHYLYLSKRHSTVLYPCTSPTHFSAQVTLNCTSLYLRPATGCKVCLHTVYSDSYEMKKIYISLTIGFPFGQIWKSKDLRGKINEKLSKT